MNIIIAGIVKRFSIKNGCVVTFKETDGTYCFTVDIDGKHKKSCFVKKDNKAEPAVIINKIEERLYNTYLDLVSAGRCL